jgi:Spy/CpxP family protein refolding chaperone
LSRRPLLFAAAFGGLLLAGTALAGSTLRGHGCHGKEPTSEIELREHLEDVSGRVLSQVDATPAQRAAVDTLLEGAAPTLWAFKQEGAELHERGEAALDGDQIDRAALESVRKDGLALADRASAEALDLFVDLANVLTVEQRAELHETIARWRD